MTEAQTKNHWDSHAAKWRHIGPPLRPCAEDTRLFEGILREWAAGRTAPPNAVLLGVTPEIARLAWPPHTRLLAVDKCAGMIARVWPGDEVPFARVVQASWKYLPVADGEADVVIGDGCFTTIAFPDDYRAVLRRLRSALKDDGLLIHRFFVRPPEPESLEAVFADLRAGRIAGLHALKWRIAMALHGPRAEDGVVLNDIWLAWRDCDVDRGFLQEKLGWTPEVMATIDNYREIPTRYTFPTLEELTAACAGLFTQTRRCYGTYELAERCPILVLEPCRPA